jgi:hypothetical protein
MLTSPMATVNMHSRCCSTATVILHSTTCTVGVPLCCNMHTHLCFMDRVKQDGMSVCPSVCFSWELLSEIWCSCSYTIRYALIHWRRFHVPTASYERFACPCATSYMIWYDIIYLLTAIGLSPGGNSTVHIYTQTIHRTIQNNQYIEQHNNWRVRAVPRLG